jgi:hypothetical protein
MSNMRRFTAILASVIALSIGAVILTTHAADQGTRPAATSPSATAVPAAGTPQVPEESATIRDDRTIAPDPKQSADNNVSFPDDI